MISSRIGFVNLNSFKMIRSLFFGMAFEKNKDDTANRLRQKIAKASNVYGILKVYEESKEHFTPVLVQASAKLTDFLEKDRNYKRQSLFNFSSEMSKLKVEKLSQQELVVMLSLLRKYEAIGFRNLKEQKDALLQTFKNTLSKKKYTQGAQIEQLFEYYELLSFYHDYNIQKLIYTNIYYLLSRQVKKQCELQISFKSMIKYFKGLYYIQQLSLRQRLIRATLLAKIQNSIQSIQIEDLVDICVNILRIDQLDFQNKELTVINKLIQKVQKELENLTKEEMLRVLCIQDHKFNRTRLINLYKSIAVRVFEIIEPDGTTQVPYSQIIDFLNIFTQKIKFYQIKQSDQDKFFIFLQRFIKSQQDNLENRSMIGKCLVNVLKYKFLDEKHRDKFQQIINKINFPVNIDLIYQLSIQDFDATHLLKRFKLLAKSKIQHSFMYGIALKSNKNINEDKELSGSLVKTQQDLQKIFTDKESFIKFVISSNIFQDSSQLFSQIFKHFSGLLLKIENPFKKQINNYEYTIAYTQFAMKIIPLQYSKTSALFEVSQKQVSQKLLKDLIMRELRQNKYSIKPMKELFFVILGKLQKIVVSKNTTLIKAILNLMIKCNRFLAFKDLDIYHEEIMWKIVRYICKNIQVLNDLGLNKQLNFFFSCYLNKQFKHYSHSKDFSNMVIKILQNLPILSSNLTLLNTIFPIALNLGLLEAKHCQDKALLQRIDLNMTQKQKIKILQDQNYEGKLQYLYKTDLYDLDTLVFNKKSIKIIEQNIQVILAKIPKYSDYQLVQILLSFNLPNNPTSRRLLHRILRTLVVNNKNLENFDMGRVFQKAQQGFFFMIEEYNQLFYRLMSNYLIYKGRMKYIDTFTFINYARFAACQPEKKETATFYEVAQQWLTINTLTNQMFLLSALIDTAFPFIDKHLQLIPKAIQLYFKAGVKMFLYLQDRLPVQKRKEIVKQIVNILSSQSKQNKQKTIQDLFYHYLKKVYPEETKSLNLESKRLSQFKFSTKPNYKVMQALEDVKNKLGLKLKLHRNFGNNQVYELNDTFIIFLSPLKTSSVYERKFLKKAIKILSNRKIPVLDFLNSLMKDQSIYLKLIKSKGLLLSEEQIEQLILKSQVQAQIQPEGQETSEIEEVKGKKNNQI